MKSKAVLAASLLLTPNACEKAQLPDKGASLTTSIEQTKPPEKPAVPDGDDNSEDENTAKNGPDALDAELYQASIALRHFSKGMETPNGTQTARKVERIISRYGIMFS